MAAEIAAGQVTFLGSLSRDEVAEFLGTVDVYVFTSHFEGCPNALLEAMMAGCVPVAWTISGITDYIITQGKTGFLCPVGDHEQFARHVALLGKQREELANISGAVAEEARSRFAREITAAEYAAVFQQVAAEPIRPWAPRGWSVFRGDENFQHNWRDVFPAKWKKSTQGRL